ncbi:MAG: cobyrinate a,c-diamide synthase [Thermodesulfobacteriota bacterium]|nr:cobyrinate a,c-diamide synthase [Thermodesulfobacteriota bacterium]
MSSAPAILICGTGSGCGKTMVTLGLMAALGRENRTVQPFKCGPDFIDPTLHTLVTGRNSYNLDIRMCGRDYVCRLFKRHAPAEGISVIEGVMGLFDGGKGSAAVLADTLNVPLLLVVDVRSAAESVGAVVKGFETLQSETRPAGVILNRIAGQRHQSLVEKSIETYCDTPVVGILPRDEQLQIPSRHLGLHLGGEKPFSRIQIDCLVKLIRQNVDLDRITTLAAKRRDIPCHENIPARVDIPVPPAVRLGVARDEAFCFYYEDNLQLFEQAGAEIIPFSPLHDSRLPPDLDGLYLGGGYPELYCPGLQDNRSMREDINRFASAGRPVYAECGGFMYLTEGIITMEGNFYQMAEIFPARARMKPRLSRLGYRTVRLTNNTLFGKAGVILHGHEFHYSELDKKMDVDRVYQFGDNRREGYQLGNTLGSYVHLHFGNTPDAVRNFLNLCNG